MTTLNYTQNDFSEGHYDPRMHARTDFQGYYKALKEADNVMLDPQGGFSKRFGTDYLAKNFAVSGPYDNDSFRIKTLEYSNGTIYIFIFAFKSDDSLNEIHIYKDVSGTFTFLQTITDTDYTGVALSELDIATGSDQIIISHETVAPHRIYQNTTESTWAFDPIVFVNQPTYVFDLNYQNAIFAVSASAIGEGVTLSITTWKANLPAVQGFTNALSNFYPGILPGTATCDGPVIGVGNRLITTVELSDEHQGGAAGVIWEEQAAPVGQYKIYATAVLGSLPANNDIVQDNVTLDYYRYNQVAHVWNELPSGTSDFEFDSTYTGGLFLGNEGTIRLTSYVSTTAMLGTVVKAFKNTSAFPGSAAALSKPVWSNTYGYPRCSSFYQNRLWFGGSEYLPTGLWGSKIGAEYFFDFDTADPLDNSGISVFLNEQSNPGIIYKVMSADNLFVFTSTGTFASNEMYNDPITAGSINIRAQNTFPISKYVDPVYIDGQVIYANATGKVIYSMQFANERQQYVTRNISVKSQELISDPKRLALLKNTSEDDGNSLLVINDDGSGALFQTMQQENIAGWTKATPVQDWIEIGGFDSYVYLIALNVAADTYFVQQIDFDAVMDFQLDGVNSPASDIINPAELSNYPSSGISVLADGYYWGEKTQDGGQIELSNAVENWSIGLNILSSVKTLPLNFTVGQNAITKYLGYNVRTLYIDYYSSIGLTVNDYALPELTADVSLFDSPPVAQTGYKKLTMMNGLKVYQEFEITQAVPFAFTIRTLSYEVEIT